MLQCIIGTHCQVELAHVVVRWVEHYFVDDPNCQTEIYQIGMYKSGTIRGTHTGTTSINSSCYQATAHPLDIVYIVGNFSYRVSHNTVLL